MAETNYGFDESTVESSGSKFIQVTPETAIATGRFIKELKFEENEGNPYIEISVVNVQGQTANRRYYAPKIDGTYTKTEEDLKKAVVKFNSLMANLSRRFLGESYKPAGVADFSSLCKVIIKDIGTKYVNKELRVKVILNKDNFPTLPAYAPVFEDVATVPSKLVINKVDNVVSTYKKPDATPDTDSQGGVPATDPDLPF
jgi:hypothetical protein